MTTQNTPRQPWMHDMKALVCAPAQLWCDPDGTMSGNGVHAGAASIAGFYLADTRILSDIAVAVNGERPTPISWRRIRQNGGVVSMVARTSKASRWTPSCGWTNGARCRRTV